MATASTEYYSPCNSGLEYDLLWAVVRRCRTGPRVKGGDAMSLGIILIILVIIYLMGGLSGRIGGYGYGMGHSGMGLGGVILVVLIVLLLLGKL
jgi:Protein of unknown function (DUF3309)